MIKHFLYCLLAHFHFFQHSWDTLPALQKGEFSASFIFFTKQAAKEMRIRYVPAQLYCTVSLLQFIKYSYQKFLTPNPTSVYKTQKLRN